MCVVSWVVYQLLIYLGRCFFFRVRYTIQHVELGFCDWRFLWAQSDRLTHTHTHINLAVSYSHTISSPAHIISKPWIYPPLSNSCKQRFIGIPEFPTKTLIILVVTGILGGRLIEPILCDDCCPYGFFRNCHIFHNCPRGAILSEFDGHPDLRIGHLDLAARSWGLISLHNSRWWQLKHFLFSPPQIGEDEPILTSIFFKGVGSTTN